MKQFRQRHPAVWGSSLAQDITEYAVMLAVIVVLVIGTIKLISGEKGKGHRQGPAPATSRNPK